MFQQAKLVESELASRLIFTVTPMWKSKEKFWENLRQNLLSTWLVQPDVLLLDKKTLGQRDFVEIIS